MKFKLSRIKFILFLLFGIFLLARALFYNHIVHIARSPDIGFHKQVSLIYKDFPWLLFALEKYETGKDLMRDMKQPGDIWYPIYAQPFFYHFIIGKLLWVFQTIGIRDYFKLVSFIQTGFGILTIVFVYKIAYLSTKNKYISFLAMVFSAFTPMFSYLINYISYDNLTNLMATLSIYYLLQFIDKKEINDICKLLLFLLTGLITKNTFAPLVIIILLVLGFYFIKDIKIHIKNGLIYFRTRDNNLIKLLVILLFLVNIVFYLKNIIHYGSVFPTYDQVITDKAMVANEFNNLLMIDTYLLKNKGKKRMNIVYYFGKWSKSIIKQNYNIVSHKSLYRPEKVNEVMHSWVVFLMILWLIELIRSLREKNKYFLIQSFIAISYSMVIFYVNYKSYLHVGEFGVATQTRYLYPVIACFSFLASYSLLNFLGRKCKIIKISLISLIVAFLFYVDTYYVVANYEEWMFTFPNLSYELGNTGPIKMGSISPRQTFYVGKDNNLSNTIGIYASTYDRVINDGFYFNLYENDCEKLIKNIKIVKIRDNKYLEVDLGNELEDGKEYCFAIENQSSELPITLWYSASDLPGNVVGNINKDLVYSFKEKY